MSTHLRVALSQRFSDMCRPGVQFFCRGGPPWTPVLLRSGANRWAATEGRPYNEPSRKFLDLEGAILQLISELRQGQKSDVCVAYSIPQEPFNIRKVSNVFGVVFKNHG